MSFSYPNPILARDLKVEVLEADSLGDLAVMVEEWGLEVTEGGQPNQRLILAQFYHVAADGAATVAIHYVE
jgi:hypothetical protein